MQHVPAQAEAGHDAGAVVLDQDVGAVHEFEEGGLVGRVLEVHGDGALVAVPGHERRAFAVDEGRHVAGAVAAPGLLDLQHIGAMVGQHHRCIGAGEMAGQVQHQEAVE